ncbi:hypothetical protein cypCar_00044523 [Cyprinus carpio]|nr:hypothetical protein cypCar_00044523 [Cyprinus carpio]
MGKVKMEVNFLTPFGPYFFLSAF